MAWLIAYGIGAAVMIVAIGAAYAEQPKGLSVSATLIAAAIWPVVVLMMVGIALGIRR